MEELARHVTGRAVGSMALALVSLLSSVACGESASDSGDAGEPGAGGTRDSAGGSTSGGASTSGGSGGDGSGGGPTVGACGAIETFEANASPTRELFVDDDATGTGDGSAAAPFATLDEALAVVTPGTAVRLLPGTYDGGTFEEGLAGSADAPIWIGGAPGEERPVIVGGNNAIQLSASSYVILHDLEVTGQTANGLNVDDGESFGAAHHLVFRDLFVHDIGSGGNQDCLKLSGIEEFYVLDSEFVGCSGGSAVDHVGCHHGIVARNRFGDLGGNGVQSKGGSDDILITQNVFVDAGQRAVNLGGSTGFEFFRPSLSSSSPNFEARNIRVVANVFRGGISPIAFVGCVDCLAANNTLVNPVQWVVRILQETTSTEEFEFLPASGGRFVNNVVHYELSALSTHVNVGPDTAPETFTFSHNLWYASDTPSSSTPESLPVTETEGVYGEDPGFTATGDESISAASPAAGAGTTLPDVPGDVTGSCYDDPPSIGAHETE